MTRKDGRWLRLQLEQTRRAGQCNKALQDLDHSSPWQNGISAGIGAGIKGKEDCTKNQQNNFALLPARVLNHSSVVASISVMTCITWCSASTRHAHSGYLGPFCTLSYAATFMRCLTRSKAWTPHETAMHTKKNGGFRIIGGSWQPYARRQRQGMRSSWIPNSKPDLLVEGWGDGLWFRIKPKDSERVEVVQAGSNVACVPLTPSDRFSSRVTVDHVAA